MVASSNAPKQWSPADKLARKTIRIGGGSGIGRGGGQWFGAVPTQHNLAAKSW
jgi:hypothetical protein